LGQSILFKPRNSKGHIILNLLPDFLRRRSTGNFLISKGSRSCPESATHATVLSLTL